MNIMACRNMLVLAGETYVSRLWCIWELCTLVSFTSVEHALNQLHIEALGDESCIDTLQNFDFASSRCFDPNEEKTPPIGHPWRRASRTAVAQVARTAGPGDRRSAKQLQVVPDRA